MRMDQIEAEAAHRAPRHIRRRAAEGGKALAIIRPVAPGRIAIRPAATGEIARRIEHQQRMA